MKNDIRVGILEDDIFSRNWMALLLVRDWRTRVVGEFGTQVELSTYLKEFKQAFDLLVLDVDLIHGAMNIDDVCNSFSSYDRPVKILLTGIHPEARIVRQLSDSRICGYVLKHEIGFSLSWAITFAFEGEWVFTPGTYALATNLNYSQHKNKLILDGRKPLPGFTEHEANVARIAIIFSTGRRDLADELKISEQWSYGLVSELYEKMGLSDIIAGEVDLFSYIGESEIIRSHFEDIIEQLGTSKKARDLETLAYHLLTMPEIVA